MKLKNYIGWAMLLIPIIIIAVALLAQITLREWLFLGGIVLVIGYVVLSLILIAKR